MKPSRPVLAPIHSTCILACLLAIPVGIAAGALDALFGTVLLHIGSMRDQHLFALVPLLPIVGVCIVWAYRTLGKTSSRGMGLVFEVGQHREREIPLRLIPLIMTSTWLTHLTGGSAGREGVAVQMGATLSHALSKRLGLTERHGSRVFVIMGMAAGFAGLFHAPLAATLFGIEVLYAGQLAYDALAPSLIASFIASGASHMLGLGGFNVAVALPSKPQLATIGALTILGIVCAIVGRAFALLLDWTKKQLAQRIPNPYAKVTLVGIALAAVLLLTGGRYCGLGTNLIDACFNGQALLPWDWALKFTLTIVTLAAGFQGGEVTPLFSIGASLAAIVAVPLGLDPVFAAALGYAAIFCSATNTFFAPVLIGAEIFGFNLIPYLFVVCAIAYTLNGDASIYGKQLINKIESLA